jgi:hypothetical protein
MAHTVCEECGRGGVRVRDLGLRRPLRLCGDCLGAAVAAWHAAADPVAVGDVLADALHGRPVPLPRSGAGSDRRDARACGPEEGRGRAAKAKTEAETEAEAEAEAEAS